MTAQNALTFRPLKEHHLSLLQEWLNKPHVNFWWGNKVWTQEDISKKYLPYTNPSSKVKAHVIEIDATPIGYIQYYKVCNFPNNLPFDVDPKMVGIDFLIGEEKYLGTGISDFMITQYIKEILPSQFTKIIADPLIENKRCISFLKKLGFIEMAKNDETYYLKLSV